MSDAFMRWWGMTALRCLDCRKRFHMPDAIAQNVRMRKARRRVSGSEAKARPQELVCVSAGLHPHAG